MTLTSSPVEMSVALSWHEMQFEWKRLASLLAYLFILIFVQNLYSNTSFNGNGNTCISQERLTALMKKILAEELEKQQQSLLKLISGNFGKAMKEIKKY